MKVRLWIEGQAHPEVIEVDSTGEGWAFLAEKVEGYLDLLSEDESLAHEQDRWDMFRDDLRARALKPWDDLSMIEAPSRRLWGVEQVGK